MMEFMEEYGKSKLQKTLNNFSFTEIKPLNSHFHKFGIVRLKFWLMSQNNFNPQFVNKLTFYGRFFRVWQSYFTSKKVNPWHHENQICLRILLFSSFMIHTSEIYQKSMRSHYFQYIINLELTNYSCIIRYKEEKKGKITVFRLVYTNFSLFFILDF